MSLLGFQRALADLAASPGLCAEAIANPAPVFQRYDLTPLEQRRLKAMVRDPLMATNCTLYRVNRVTPIYMYFPMTCQILGPGLRRQLDAFWSTHRAEDLQYVPETARFARFLKRQVQSGELRNDFIEEIVDYEAAMMELRFAPDSDRRRVRFSHDPARLLESLSKSDQVPANLEAGEYWVEISASDGELVTAAARL